MPVRLRLSRMMVFMTRTGVMIKMRNVTDTEYLMTDKGDTLLDRRKIGKYTDSYQQQSCQ